MSIKGLTYRGALKQSTENNSEGVQLEHATLSYKGPSKMALDTAPHGVYLVGAADRVCEAGSNEDTIVLTGHDARVGDIIRPKTTAATMEETEIAVRSITDANTIQLDGLLSGAFAALDTFDIYRPITQRLNSDGSTVADTMKIDVLSGGTTTSTNVLDDQDTPANTVPIPVKLYGTSASVTITSEELNVQLSHSAASPDSVQLGDGTQVAQVRAATASAADEHSLYVTDFLAGGFLNTLAGTVSGSELQVDIVDGGPVATEVTLAAMSAKLPASLGIKADAASLSVTQSTEDRVVQAAIQTAVETLDNAISGNEMQVDIVDGGPVATEVTLSAMSGKLPASLGIKADASSLSTTMSTEDRILFNRVVTSVETLDNAISGNEMQVDLVGIADVATETTLAAQSAKLPASLGAKTSAASLSVTMSTDEAALNTNQGVVDFLDSGVVDASSTNIPSASNLAVVASLANDVTKIQIIDDIGEFMTLRNAGGTILAYLPLGGGEVEVTIASGTALGLRSETGSDISLGNIAINFLG